MHIVLTAQAVFIVFTQQQLIIFSRSKLLFLRPRLLSIHYLKKTIILNVFFCVYLDYK